MTNPIKDMVNFLHLDGTLSLTRGTNLYQGLVSGPDSQIPVNAVFVSSISSEQPQRVMGLGTEIRSAMVQIMLRWSRFGAGNTKAQAIQIILQDAAISGYLDIVGMESLPTHIGQDEGGHHLFMSIYKMVFEETS